MHAAWVTGVVLASAALLAGCSGPDAGPAATEPVPVWMPPQPDSPPRPLPENPIVDPAGQYRVDGTPGAFAFFAAEIEGTNDCYLRPASEDLPAALTCFANFDTDDLPVIVGRGATGPAEGIALTADAVTAIPRDAIEFDNPGRLADHSGRFFLRAGHTVDFGNGFVCTALDTWGLDCSSPGAGFQKVDWGQAVLRGNVVGAPYAIR